MAWCFICPRRLQTCSGGTLGSRLAWSRPSRGCVRSPPRTSSRAIPTATGERPVTAALTLAVGRGRSRRLSGDRIAGHLAGRPVLRGSGLHCRAADLLDVPDELSGGRRQPRAELRSSIRWVRSGVSSRRTSRPGPKQAFASTAAGLYLLACTTIVGALLILGVRFLRTSWPRCGACLREPLTTLHPV